MRTGELRRRQHGRGFTYVWLLFVVAVAAGALATQASSWSGAAARDREREQVFRGRQIAVAIARFREASPEGQLRGPRDWDELLEDRRGPRPRHHLREAYADPFTGRPDWEPQLDEGGGWTSVRSRSQRAALLRFPDDPQPGAGGVLKLSDRVHVAVAARAPTGAASPPQAASAGG